MMVGGDSGERRGRVTRRVVISVSVSEIRKVKIIYFSLPKKKLSTSHFCSEPISKIKIYPENKIKK